MKNTNESTSNNPKKNLGNQLPKSVRIPPPPKK